MNPLDRAITLAVKAHENQKDKSGNPYILHPLRVMMKLKSTEEQIVAVLHDVLEDTDIEYDYIKKAFDSNIALAIQAITHQKNEPRYAYYDRIKRNKIALRVKFADIEDNMDKERMSLLDEETQQRLIKKYTKALEYLKGDYGIFGF